MCLPYLCQASLDGVVGVHGPRPAHTADTQVGCIGLCRIMGSTELYHIFCVYTYMYIYIYVEKERERERKREKERERERKREREREVAGGLRVQ